MQRLKGALTLALISLFAFQALAQTNAETIDLAKFRSKGQLECERALGKDNIVGQPVVFFQDGAGSLDLPPVFDYASFFYVVSVRQGILPRDNVLLAYRLQLNGQEDLVQVEQTDNGQGLIVSVLNSGIVTLRPGITKSELEKLVSDLKLVSPNINLQIFEEIGVFQFDSPSSDTARVFGFLSNYASVAAVEFNTEYYRRPFAFDPIVQVLDAGTIDADKYRRLTKELKEQGFPFASRTIVPPDLK
jgi:hypothetical protein